MFAVLRHPAFRWIWLGALISNTGNWMEAVAQSWLVQQQTGSPFMVELLAASEFVPHAVLMLAAGWLADHYNRRKLLLAGQSVMMVLGVGRAGPAADQFRYCRLCPAGGAGARLDGADGGRGAPHRSPRLRHPALLSRRRSDRRRLDAGPAAPVLSATPPHSDLDARLRALRPRLRRLALAASLRRGARGGRRLLGLVAGVLHHRDATARAGGPARPRDERARSGDHRAAPARPPARRDGGARLRGSRGDPGELRRAGGVRCLERAGAGAGHQRHEAAAATGAGTARRVVGGLDGGVAPGAAGGTTRSRTSGGLR